MNNINTYKNIEKYIKNIKNNSTKTSYKSIIAKLSGKLRKKDLNEKNKKTIENNINLLRKWKKSKNLISSEKEINKIKTKLINMESNIQTYKKQKIMNSSLIELKKNIQNDFNIKISNTSKTSKTSKTEKVKKVVSKNINSKNKKVNKNVNIKELSNKQILNMIKKE